MKRAFVDRRQSLAVDEARAKLKHQTLLQEYLQLQKEFVSQKKKLQSAKQKRDSLLAEVRFLRRRRKYLLKIQHPKLVLEEDRVQPQNSDIPRKMFVNRRNCITDEAPLRVEEEGEQIVQEPLRVEKSRNWLRDDRRVRKKKISWQDQLPLKV